jgi:hypothetical protein
VHLRADDEDISVLAGTNQGVANLQCVHKARALQTYVQTPHGGQSQLVLEHGPRSGEVIIGSHRGEYDVVDLFPGHARVGESPLGSANGEIARGFVEIGELARDDTGSLADPLVAGIHDSRHAVVVDRVGRDVNARTLDDGSHADSLWGWIHSPVERRECQTDVKRCKRSNRQKRRTASHRLKSSNPTSNAAAMPEICTYRAILLADCQPSFDRCLTGMFPALRLLKKS